jgi:hypothetical protein
VSAVWESATRALGALHVWPKAEFARPRQPGAIRTDVSRGAQALTWRGLRQGLAEANSPCPTVERANPDGGRDEAWRINFLSILLLCCIIRSITRRV